MATKIQAKQSRYKPEYCEMLISHMAEGLSIEAFCGVVRRCKQTVYTWFDEHPEFKEAKEIGTGLSRLWWEKQGKDGLWGSKESSFNASVWIFNMKNRHGWKDKQPDEVDRTVINLAGLSEDELRALVKEGMPELFKESKGKK